MNDSRDTARTSGPDPNTAYIEARFNGIENEVRRLRSRNRVLGMGFLLALVGAVSSWIVPGVVTMAAAGDPDLVRTERLVLTGPDGEVRGEWSVDAEGNAAIRMQDRQGRERLAITVRSEGYPGLSLTNAAGERRVALGLLPDETTSLVFADGAGVPRAVMGLARGDAANLLLADADGVSRIGFGLAGDGMGSVILPDEEPEESSDSDESTE